MFAAEDLIHQRPVAIKILRVELAGARARRRFLQEIEFTRTLDHPNILPLLDSGEVGDIIYYVMPFVAGESLQQLLSHEGQQPVTEVLRVGRAVLEALAHAHAASIVHRDIKPGNILLDKDRVLVGDFGIARALHRTAAEERISSPGVNVGTPAYMSPEQATGAPSLDGRSDLYSLGCVLYEMVAGSPPFAGPTGTALAARHAMDPVPPLRTVRQSVPVPLERLILRALEKSPADRFSTAPEMLAALEAASTPESLSITAPRRSRWSASKRRNTALAGFAGSALLALALWRFWPSQPWADPNLYVVFPFEVTADLASIGDPAQLLRDALRQWSGIKVVDRFTMQSRIAARSDDLTPAKAAAIARKLGSGRFVQGRFEPDGDGLRLTATLFDPDSGQLFEMSERLTRGLREPDSVLARFAERLLFHGIALSPRIEPAIGTSSFPARSAYLTAHQMIREWDLSAADSLLFRAVGVEPGYSQAALWLALVRYWREEPPERWRDLVERARGNLRSEREGQISAALLSWATDSIEASCVRWEALAEREPDDGLLWYSAARCRALDDAVIRDPRSPTGWRFRSSHRLALAHHERAFRMTPTLYRGVRDDGFERLRFLLNATSNTLKRGRALAPDSLVFVAYPSIAGDTLVFYPIPLSDVRVQGPLTRQALGGVPAAIRRQREVLRDWATTWSTNYPRSAEALEAVAIGLEAVGDASALDRIAEARGLVTTPAEEQRIRGTQAWLLLKFGLPSDEARLRWARSLADSVLNQATRSPGDRKLQVSLAALTGRLRQARQLAEGIRSWPRALDPEELNIVSGALLLEASLGGSPSELRRLERLADSLVKVRLPDERWGLYRRDLIARSAVLSFPAYRSPILSDATIKGFPLLEVLREHEAGNLDEALTRLRAVRSIRASIPAEDVQVDVLLPEASLLASLAGAAEASSWIEPTLAALRFVPQTTFLDPVRAASLIKIMALYAELASQLGDRASARTWAKAVAILLENCDPELRPLRDRMRTLTS